VDTIVRTEQLKDTGDTVGPYVVRTAIYDQVTSDRGFFDHGVTLNYSVGAGPGKQVPMTWSGNSLWRGEIPGQPEGGTVAYFVTALDSADNLGVGKDLSFTVGPLLGDLNGDGTVGAVDLLILLASWGPRGDCTDCPADLNGDYTVGVADLLILLANWG
jgi:hypothetical protein